MSRVLGHRLRLPILLLTLGVPGTAMSQAAIPEASPTASEDSAAAAQVPGPRPESRAVRLTLSRAIDIARAQSPSALLATHRYRASYWQYVTFRADYRPSLDIDTTPLNWQRTIAQQTLADGTDAFVPRSQANSSADLSLNKVLTWTGGQISLRSEIARTEALEGDGGLQYFSTPLEVFLYQPLFAFNSHRWAARIEPARYAEARQQFIEDLESISTTAIAYFFDLLSAQTAVNDAMVEKAQADTLDAVTRRRFNEGRAPETDALQAELARLNADLRLERARVDVAVKQQRLATFLGVGDAPAFELVPTTEVPAITVDFAVAVDQAKRNRPLAMSFERQLLEADRSVAQARATRGGTVLTASYGLSRATEDLSQLYRDPRVDQQVRLSVRTPILDWGRSRARVAVSESQREVTRRQVEQSRDDFERDVYLQVSQFEIQARQLRLATLADSVGQRRFEMTRERYLGGRGDLNSVNIARVEKENARRGYLDAMRNYWMDYYDVRKATLYDFERRQPLRAPTVRF